VQFHFVPSIHINFQSISFVTDLSGDNSRNQHTRGWESFHRRKTDHHSTFNELTMTLNFSKLSNKSLDLSIAMNFKDGVKHRFQITKA